MNNIIIQYIRLCRALIDSFTCSNIIIPNNMINNNMLYGKVHYIIGGYTTLRIKVLIKS